MAESLSSRFKRSLNVFMNRDPTITYSYIGPGSSYKPDRSRFTIGKERSIVTSVYNRLALDASAVNLNHVKIDDNGLFISYINSGLNRCLSVNANSDQSHKMFLQDVYMSLMDEGIIAIVPIDIDVDDTTGKINIESVRVGKILEWFPENIKVEVYNENTGKKESIIVSKKDVAICENPFYSIMNEYNSTMQRLIRKLNLLDAIDEQSGSGKLDLIIQLPYTIKSPARKQQAEDRRKDIVMQLTDSKYGIAYTDGTEKITQLNRPVENNLMKQIEYLTSMLYSQLGITQSILDGTADEKTMLNYNHRIIEQLVVAVVDAMIWKFIPDDSRDSESISIFIDPFKLVPVNNLAEIADKFTRNEILSANEIRQIIGRKPSNDPGANELRNKNLNATAPKEPLDDFKETKN